MQCKKEIISVSVFTFNSKSEYHSQNAIVCLYQQTLNTISFIPPEYCCFSINYYNPVNNALLP